MKQKGGFLGMLIFTVGTSLLGNVFAVKGFIRAGEGTNRAGQDFLARSHPLTNLEMQRYYQKEPRFHDVY